MTEVEFVLPNLPFRLRFQTLSIRVVWLGLDLSQKAEFESQMSTLELVVHLSLILFFRCQSHHQMTALIPFPISSDLLKHGGLLLMYYICITLGGRSDQSSVSPFHHTPSQVLIGFCSVSSPS